MAATETQYCRYDTEGEEEVFASLEEGSTTYVLSSFAKALPKTPVKETASVDVDAPAA